MRALVSTLLVIVFTAVLTGCGAFSGDLVLKKGYSGVSKTKTLFSRWGEMGTQLGRTLPNGDVIYAHTYIGSNSDSITIVMHGLEAGGKQKWVTTTKFNRGFAVHSIVLHGDLATALVNYGEYPDNYSVSFDRSHREIKSEYCMTVNAKTGALVGAGPILVTDTLLRIADAADAWPLTVLLRDSDGGVGVGSMNSKRLVKDIGSKRLPLKKFDHTSSPGSIHVVEYKTSASGELHATSYSSLNGGELQKAGAASKRPLIQEVAKPIESSIQIAGMADGVIHAVAYHYEDDELLSVTPLTIDTRASSLAFANTFEITDSFDSDTYDGMRDTRVMPPVLMPNKSILIVQEDRDAPNFVAGSAAAGATYRADDAGMICLGEDGALKWSAVLDKSTRQDVSDPDLGVFFGTDGDTLRAYYRTKASDRGFAGIDINLNDGGWVEREFVGIDASTNMIFHRNSVVWPNGHTVMSIWRNGPGGEEAEIITLDVHRVSETTKPD